MKKNLLLCGTAAALTLSLASCNSAGKVNDNAEAPTDSTVAVAEAQPESTAFDKTGVYTGVIPCADCGGIETTLELRADGTYSLTEIYKDKKDGRFESSGKFQWDAANACITVGEGERLMIRFVLRTRERVSDIRQALPLLGDLVPSAHVVTANIHPTHEAIVEGPDEIILTRARTLPLSVEGLELGPRSFTQTNAHVASALYEQAALWASHPFADGRLPESLWDLYCGVGGFALACARAGFPRVTGVEVSSGAISSAISAARHAGLSRRAATFITDDATSWARAQPEADVPDVIVVNPPRRGIGADLAAYLDQCGAPRVIYSSCNPTSLAKDLAAMPSLRPVEGRLFDMFPHTTHAEVAVLLERAGA